MTTSIARKEQQQWWQKYFYKLQIHAMLKHGPSICCVVTATKRSFCTSSEATTSMSLAWQKLTSQGKGEYDMEEGIKLIYNGEEEGGEAWCEVRFLLNRKAAKALTASHPISAQIISIQLSCLGMKLSSLKCTPQLLSPVTMKLTVFTMTYKSHSTASPKRAMLLFWETSMQRLVFTSPYGKIP